MNSRRHKVWWSARHHSILSNLLLEAKGNRLTITATDLELSVRTLAKLTSRKKARDDPGQEASGARSSSP